MVGRECARRLIHIKEAGMKIYSDALPGFEYALSEKSTLSIYQDEKENIWIGTDGGGINRLDPVTKKCPLCNSHLGR